MVGTIWAESLVVQVITAQTKANTDTNNCYIKQWIPNSPGLSAKGGMVNGMRMQGHACRHEWPHCSQLGVGSNHYNFPRAGGGISGTTCGDGQCCGAPGGTGMVKVTYK